MKCSLNSLDKVLHRCSETHVILNYENFHFMVEHDIVLEDMISKNGI